MHQHREDLDILFRRTLPETVLESMRTYNRFNKFYPLQTEAGEYSYEAYEHYSALNLMKYSSDETEMRYRALSDIVDSSDVKSVFNTLYIFADEVLDMKNGKPVCRIAKILNWNSIVLRLGQDIFTTAWLAKKDVDRYDIYIEKKKFNWAAVLKTDDRKLELLFQKGLAENHFHLHGSTQSFALSWACLMNHPEFIKKYLLKEAQFAENLNFSVSKGSLDNQLNWDKRLLYAAMIRALLFMRITGIMSSREVWENFCKFDRLPIVTTVKHHTEALRSGFGVKFSKAKCKQKYLKKFICKQSNYKQRCLDYAICEQLYDVDEKSSCRLLAGERSFLYHCFKKQFAGEFSEQESSLLYMYILLKSNFRSELIQCNDRYGFKNFLNYQDRKNQFFEEMDEYWTEAQRLSVGEAMENNHVVSLEARIMSKNSPMKMRQAVEELRGRMEAFEGFKKDNLHFVVHFPKDKFSESEFENKKFRLIPRNKTIRYNCVIKSKSLHKFLRIYNITKPYISGIDACSAEIGCRPETFATEFRYLRDFINKRRKVQWYEREEVRLSKLGVTYHVGEDYLDILDGLRAIDEAILFLELGKEDRLGHAIALGIDPEDYYQLKNRNIYISKQDCLDNIIWLLNRSLEFDIVIEPNYRSRMLEEARKLFHEIYIEGTSLENASYLGDVLDLYYSSWKLRGDHPDLYSSGEFREKMSFSVDCYENYMKRDKKLDCYRKNKRVVELYYLYHFDRDVKLKGLKTISCEVPDFYIQVVKQMQEALRLEVLEKKIAIECNPSSNVLISTFRKYDKHPILAFNNYHLDNSKNNPYIDVSINTDDIGVFDTSLENEYALLFCAIRMERHRKGLYDDNVIYEYLEHLRENGIRMSFQRDICQ